MYKHSSCLGSKQVAGLIKASEGTLTAWSYVEGSMDLEGHMQISGAGTIPYMKGDGN